MAIKVAAWNVEGRLTGDVRTGRGTAGHILKGIERLDADVVVLPEAFMDTSATGVLECFEELGYKVLSTAYEDRDRKRDKYFHGMMHLCVMSRLPVSDVTYVRPGDIRNLIMCQVTDPESGHKLRLIGTHLEDRSEALRIAQVEGLVGNINGSDAPLVMLGDFNAMWHEGLALPLGSRIARYVAGHIPLKILRGVAVRVADMAAGTALTLLSEKTPLREADPSHRPTATPKRYGALWMPSIRLIQIDHMFVSPEITVSNFTVERDGGSDHRAISARISFPQMKRQQ